MIKVTEINFFNRYGLHTVIAIIALLIITVIRLDAAEVCEARLDCPMNYADDTLRLPPNVISLSKVFNHCAPTFFDESYKPGNVDTISLFFVIDHSASMSQMDSNCVRYQLVSKLIDSLKANSPASEIGMAVFSNQLLHNVNTDDYAVALDPAGGFTDAYIPLTKLDGEVKGQSASEYLKNVIKLSETEEDIGFNKKLVNCYYDKSGRHSGFENQENILTGYNGTTDITLAFEAARKAFKSALYPKNKQYIIFLSDGVPQNVDLERKSYQNDFVKGLDLPTTFTAFWISEKQPVPDTINMMTDAIRKNGYSETNKYSEVWKTSGDVNELLSKLLNISTGQAFSIIHSTPVKLTINKVDAASFDDSAAYFDNSIALQSPLTKLDISFTYHFGSPLDTDSTRNLQLLIKSEKGATLPADIETVCHDQGTLKFFVNNNEMKGTISDDDKNIEIRYYPSDGTVSNSVNIHIYNAEATDNLVLTASKSGSYYFVNVTRETGDVKVDGLLQTSANDSIIAFYQNEDFPLDIVKESRPIGAARNLGITSACYFDQDADGYPDLIRVVEGGDKLSSEDLALVQPYLYISSSRGVSIKSVTKTSPGFDIVLTNASTDKRFTGLYPNEKLGVKNVTGLPGGGSFPASTVSIVDSMAPVVISGQYLNGSHAQNSEGTPDTLVVTFSEICDSVRSSNAFKFFDYTNNVNYSMNLSTLSAGEGTVQRFIVNSVNGKQSPSHGDSIWINESASVTDLSGNIQDNAQNHRAAMVFVALQYNFVVQVCPTPADPKNDPIPRDIYTQFADQSITKGVVVVIKSSETLLPQDTVNATISIYDPMGNAVVKDDRCTVSKENGKLFYGWNGTNRNGRFVGNGTYVAVVKVTVSNGVSRTIKARIGILYR